MATREMLIYVDTNGNNNKFYELTELPDGVSVRYGRVGSEGTTRVFRGYSAYETKKREKLRRGYVPFAGDSARKAPAPNKGADAQASVVKGLFAKDTDAAKALAAHLVSNNRHSIALGTGGKITVSDSGAVTTALGPVTPAQLYEAEEVLNRIERKLPPARAVSTSDISRYLTLIPQKISNLRNIDKWLTREWVREQRDLLDALRTAVTLNAPVSSDDTVEAMKARHTLVEVAKSSKVFKDIEKRFRDSMNAMHVASSYKPVRVWAVTDENAPEWDKLMEDRKWHRTLWHGTTAGNVLSILRTGLICPPSSDARYATSGRMFGDGVYFSDQSTKSLNYAVGAWNRNTGTGNPMMFLSDVAMGREYRTTASDTASTAVRAARTGKDHKGRPHTSLFVKAGTCGVRNNEMIVWDSAAIKITYLVEFAK